MQALVDTGSQISAMDFNGYEELKESGEEVSETRVSNVTLISATGARIKSITKQIQVTVRIAETEMDVMFLVVKKLIKPIILGNDWCALAGAVLDFRQNEATLSQIGGVKIGGGDGRNIYLTSNHVLTEQTGDKGRMVLKKMEDSEEDIGDTMVDNTQRGRDDVNKCQNVQGTEGDEANSVKMRNIDSSMKDELAWVLKKYDSVFSDDPGVTDVYQHRLNIPDPNLTWQITLAKRNLKKSFEQRGKQQ